LGILVLDAEEAQIAFSGLSDAARLICFSATSATQPLDIFSTTTNARASVDEGELNSYEFF
jgi:hypothetical protein